MRKSIFLYDSIRDRTLELQTTNKALEAFAYTLALG